LFHQRFIPANNVKTELQKIGVDVCQENSENAIFVISIVAVTFDLTTSN